MWLLAATDIDYILFEHENIQMKTKTLTVYNKPLTINLMFSVHIFLWQCLIDKNHWGLNIKYGKL